MLISHDGHTTEVLFYKYFLLAVKKLLFRNKKAKQLKSGLPSNWKIKFQDFLGHFPGLFKAISAYSVIGIGNACMYRQCMQA